MASFHLLALAVVDPKNTNFLRGTTLGILVGITLQLGGYLLLRGERSEFGWAMFVAMPLVSGFAVAAVVRSPMRVTAACLVAGCITFSLLLFTGWEGIVCCVMALPLVVAGVSIGAILGYFVRGRFIDRMAAPGKVILFLVLLCPFFIAAADRVERPYRSIQQREVFTTETLVEGSPEQCWDLVARMHKLDGPRPFLLRVGLPVPTRCELDHARVGGRRVCYFDQGLIAQEVTDWQRPHFMGLRVTESTLPGREWLTFLDASYEHFAAGTRTRVVRHTAIGTRLYPRWYWRPLERWGVISEHEFVFSNLRRWTTPPSRDPE